MKTKVIVLVRSGMVQCAYANGDVELDVVDLDVSDFPDEGEQEVTDLREEQFTETIKQDGWEKVW